MEVYHNNRRVIIYAVQVPEGGYFERVDVIWRVYQQVNELRECRMSESEYFHYFQLKKLSFSILAPERHEIVWGPGY